MGVTKDTKDLDASVKEKQVKIVSPKRSDIKTQAKDNQVTKKEQMIEIEEKKDKPEIPTQTLVKNESSFHVSGQFSLLHL